jgi:spermidine synthase
MLAELDKYRLETVDYVEIDPAAVRLQVAAGLMPAGAAVNRIHQDGRAYLAAAGRRYDAIVLAVAEPDTLQLNRYFTESFLRRAAPPF